MQYGHTIANRYFDGNEICKRYQKKVYHCYGDPSMRIYTRQPMEVPEITIEREPTRLRIKVNDNRQMYISIYDPKTNEVELYYGNEFQKFYQEQMMGQPIIDHTGHLVITVYNDNYKPKVFKNRFFIGQPSEPIIGLGTLDSCTPMSNGQVKVMYSGASESSLVRVIVADINGNQHITCDYNAMGEADIDINELEKGVYIVSLYIDGNYIDSKRILK